MIDNKDLRQPVSRRRTALRMAGLGGAIGTCVAVSWLVPARADPGHGSVRATSTIVGDVVGRVTHLGVLHSSLAGPASGPTSLTSAPRPPAVSPEPPGPVLPAGGALSVTAPGFSLQPAGNLSSSGAPASTTAAKSPSVAAPEVKAAPAVQPVVPAVVEKGGSSVGTTTADGGGGGDITATVVPTAVSGDSGSTQAQSSSSNSGATGDATSAAISNPSSSSGGSGESGGSGATESTPSVVSTNP